LYSYAQPGPVGSGPSVASMGGTGSGNVTGSLSAPARSPVVLDGPCTMIG
jgi:hypothetical protein